jgi:protein-L-isoaspartate(D-aspartate) O-methyltransferase
MCWRSTVLLIALFAAPVLSWSDNSTEAEMLWREVESELATIGPELGFVKLSPRVLEALKNVPRDRFVPEAQQDRAYRNTPLPIGHGQTISQPFIVAIMTELLDPQPGDRVFELGTGSGYQAAVLSRLVAEVYSMEIVAPLGARAGRILADLGYDNAHVRIGDGYKGWPDQAPFDAIVVTAAGDHIPPPLIAQLKPGGRMVMPVGSRFFTQQLVLLEKTVDGAIRTRELLPVAFVPLTGER